MRFALFFVLALVLGLTMTLPIGGADMPVVISLYNALTDNWGDMIMVEGHPQGKFDEDTGASWTRLSANYLQLLAQPLRRGRYFTEADTDTAPNVAVVNEAFVKRFFNNFPY